MALAEQEFHAALDFLYALPASKWQMQRGLVQIGADQTLNQAQQQKLLGILHNLRPFRKGPFEIYGTRIDANWRSDTKWQRLQTILGSLGFESLQSLRVCDVGANNGYFLFGLVGLHPARIVALDPTVQFYQQFRVLQALAGLWSVEFLQAGYQVLQDFSRAFDLHLCMGVLYHQSDPMHLLRHLHHSLRPGGYLILESLCLPAGFSDQALSLIPQGRFLGMRGVWNVPSPQAIRAWLHRSGFSQIECVLQVDAQSCAEEQQRTAWADMPGYADALDPSDPTTLTIEGYPLPERHWYVARRA